MAWSSDFVRTIGADAVFPRLWLQVGGWAVGRALSRPGMYVSSHGGGRWVQALQREGTSISWGRLQIPSFIMSTSRLSVGVSSDINPLPLVSRGMLVQLFVGDRPPGDGATERVFLGTLRSVQHTGAGWILQCQGIEGSLNSRFTADKGKLQLFNKLATSTVGTNYTTGTTISQVPTSATWESSEPGGVTEGWLLEVTPNTGANFFLLAAVQSAPPPNWTYGTLTKNFMATTDANANAGNEIRHWSYTNGHPLDIARAMLVSTGGGGNGARDFYPETWGWGLPANMVAHADIERHKSDTDVVSNDWVLRSRRVDSGLSLLQSWMGPAGFFLGQWQGRVTARAARNPLGAVSEAHITHADIVSIDSWSAWASEIQREYYSLRVDSEWDTGSNEAYYYEPRVKGLPAAVQAQITIPLWGNQQANTLAVAERIGPLYCRVPEHGVLTLRGFRHAGLAPGDVISITSDRMASREGGGYNVRKALVVGGGPDWFNGTTTLEFFAYPPSQSTASNTAPTYDAPDPE